jgi:gamma-glutamyltranspeptidase/glutathione hydrolase
VALQALGIIKQLEARNVISLDELEHNSAEYLHVIIEALKLAFKDGEEYIADPAKADIDYSDLLKDDYLFERSKLFDPNSANNNFDHGLLDPSRKSDTSYFTVTDGDGSACSFINSNFETFGSGVVPPQCGFALQNRGANFNLKPDTRNVFEGGKRPYHTIIPAMITNSDESLYATYGVMGGFMQPQGHLQVLINLVIFEFNPQQALDAPRICLTNDTASKDSGRGAQSPVSSARTIVQCEKGIPPDVIKKLKGLGHNVNVPEKFHTFGRGQVIKKRIDERGQIVYAAGSDMRGDGAAIPYI